MELHDNALMEVLSRFDIAGDLQVIRGYLDRIISKILSSYIEVPSIRLILVSTHERCATQSSNHLYDLSGRFQPQASGGL